MQKTQILRIPGLNHYYKYYPANTLLACLAQAFLLFLFALSPGPAAHDSALIDLFADPIIELAAKFDGANASVFNPPTLYLCNPLKFQN